jgi:pentapeptide MXKDX repeat protein
MKPEVNRVNPATSSIRGNVIAAKWLFVDQASRYIHQGETTMSTTNRTSRRISPFRLAISLVTMAAMTTMALAAPSFVFGKDAAGNMMMKGETIAIAAAPSIKLLGRNITKQSAILIYETKSKTAAHDLFAFYEQALMKDGWKNAAAMKSDAMKGDAMMGDTMKPDAMKGDAMKPDAMKGDAMKPDAMKPDAMMGGTMKPDAMMGGTDKPEYTATFALKTHSITLISKATGDRVTISMQLK